IRFAESSADRQFWRDDGTVRPQAAWAHTTINTRNPERSAIFWGALLDAEPVERSDGWYVLGPTAIGGPMLYFQPVADQEGSSTRAHLDVWVNDLASAIELVQDLGGQVAVASHAVAAGTLAVMLDPDGTEFCLITFPH
ncbi:MAG TPA: VOC family protein, partial [Galbitalea sp.]